MGPYTQLTSEQLKDIIEDERQSDNDAMEVEMQVQDGKQIMNRNNTSSVLLSI
jgi:hypothetical protein